MSERSSFGPELRRARERRGLSLQEIAEQTKVSVSLYQGLENNDLSRWPSGLFRRAFVRNYAAAVGLDPEETCRRFVRLFPEHEGDAPEMHAVPTPAPPTAEPVPDGTPRLMLAEVVPSADAQPTRIRRLAAAGIDLSIAAVPAAVAGLFGGMEWFWMVAAIVVAVGHPLAFVVRGRTPGALALLPAAAPPVESVAKQARRRAETEGPVLVSSRGKVAPIRPQRSGNVRTAGRRGRR